MSIEALSRRITEYLSGGGLFNPELADHNAVRDLLIDCRAALDTAAPAEPVAWVYPDALKALADGAESEHIEHTNLPGTIPLYTTPPAPEAQP